MTNITQDDYFLKNFISKALAIIASKENKENFDHLIKIISENLLNIIIENQYNYVDNYLRLLLNILKETDNTVYYITGDLLKTVCKVFSMSSV